ncbi:hypothetical protein ACSD7O_19580 [Methylorubrum extorquens]|uniref:hypothetical protein n=1 Tax=Methylorubrum extorquens TaxID=408 RepID=UPI003F631DFE
MTILYTNYRNETAVRRILIDAIAYGNEALGLAYGWNEWHPEEQWLLSATDADKGERRTFAMAGIKAWGQAAVDAALASSTPDPAATPGVPDSLRALMDAARPFYACFFNDNGDMSISTGNLTIDHWLALDRAFTAANATQPAGQAGDAGAEAPRGVIGPIPRPFAANSTRTGAAETEDGWLRKAADEIDKIADLWSADGRAYAKTIAAMFRAEAYRQGLAARPEAPSDAGKGRPIDTAPKDRSEILLFGSLKGSGAKPTWFVGAWFPCGSYGHGWWVSSCVEVIATAWAPLPTAPSDPAPSGQAEG